MEFESDLKEWGDLTRAKKMRCHFCIHKDEWHPKWMESRNNAIKGRECTSFGNGMCSRLTTTQGVTEHHKWCSKFAY